MSKSKEVVPFAGQLPSIFDGPATPAPIVESKEGTAYAVYAHPQSPSYPDWARAIPGLKEGDVVFVPNCSDEEGNELKPIKVEPFRFTPFCGFQYWCECDRGGQMLRAWTSKPRYEDVIKEHIETVILIYFGRAVYPARMTFKSTKCGPAKVGLKALEFCMSDEWLKQSAAHTVMKAAPKPWQRFTIASSLTPRTGKSGFKYLQANGTEAPATPDDWTVLAEFLRSETANQTLEELKKAHDQRIKEIESLASRTR
jgi:hypothetical protein